MTTDTKKESQKPPAADDSAPAGKSYQAESPDEGALVSAAATVYSVRLVDRRADGLVLSRDRPSPLRRDDVVAALKEGRLGNVVVPGYPDDRAQVRSRKRATATESALNGAQVEKIPVGSEKQRVLHKHRAVDTVVNIKRGRNTLHTTVNFLVQIFKYFILYSTLSKE